MADTRFIQDLGDGFNLRVFLSTERGQVVNFAVALVRDGECITRYDCAHDVPHRDVNGRESALVKKIFCFNVTKAEAYIDAIRDLRKNFRQYYAFYDAN